MYRPPINPGYDLIGAAIADALGRATGSMRAFRLEDREEDRYKAQQQRQERLDRMAEEDRKRVRELQDAELGVIGEREAYADPIRSAIIDRTSPAAPIPDLRPMVGGERQDRTRRLRDGVVQVGDRFADPRRSLSFRRGEIEREAAREVARSERDREIAEAAARLMGLDPKMTREEAVARAAGLSATSPLTRAQVLAQRREELELADVFNRRESDRSFARSLALRREGKKEEGATMGRARRQNEAEGYALTAAHDAIRTGQTNPLGGIRVRLRAQLGNRFTEGEIQEMAVRALNATQNQGMRQQDFTRRNTLDEDDAELDEVQTPASRPTQRSTDPALAEARAEWDSIYADIQKISDPVQRNRAIRELGSRP